MSERRCRACGASEQPGANFCAQCGVASDAEYVDLGQDDATEVPDVGRSGLAKVLVPLGVFALVGLLVAALIGAGSDAPDPDARSSRPTAAPVATLPATPTAEATVTPTATPRPTPTPTPSAVNAPVDPSTLPSTDATHLAIAYRSTVDFLDLRTGTWSRAEVGRTIAVDHGPLGGSGINAFGRGALVQAESGHLVVVPITGDVVDLLDPFDSISLGLLAVRGEVAFIQDFADQNRRLMAVSPTGEVLFEITLDERMWATGVTADGLIALQAGSGVVLVGAEGSISLGNGILNGVVGNKVLLYDCVSLTECGTELVDVATGQRTATPLTGEYFQSNSSDRIVGYDGRGGSTVYRLVDDQLIEVPAALQPTNNPEQGLGLATDSAGMSARVVLGQIELLDDAGAVLASVPFQVDQCCRGGFGLAFVYAE